MLSRVLLNTIGRIFPKTRPEPTNWEEAYQASQEDIKALTKRLEDLQKAVQQWSEELNKPNRLAITQATIDASPIGSIESSTGEFSRLGVAIDPPAAGAANGVHTIMGASSGRQWTVANGGASGNDSGPAFVLAYGGSALQGMGGASAVGISASFDDRLAIVGGSKDILLAPGTTSQAVDFLTPVNGAAAGVGTLTNAPSAGDPSYWLKIKIAGNVRYIPAWS